jgi:hypothetical protein
MSAEPPEPPGGDDGKKIDNNDVELQLIQQSPPELNHHHHKDSRPPLSCMACGLQCTLGHNITIVHVISLLLGGWLVLCALVASTAAWAETEICTKTKTETEICTQLTLTLWEGCDDDGGGCQRLDSASLGLLNNNIKAAQAFALMVLFATAAALICNVVEFVGYRRAKHSLTLTALVIMGWAVFCGIVAMGAYADADIDGLDVNGAGFGFCILGWMLGAVQISIYVWFWREQDFRVYSLCRPPPPASKVFHIPLTTIYKQWREPLPICIDVVMRVLKQQAGHARLFVQEHDEAEVKRALVFMEAHSADMTVEMLLDAPFTPSTLCALLMHFLEHLPVPVLGFAQYPSFLRSMDRLEDVYAGVAETWGPSDQKFYVQSLLVGLPKPHFLVLRSLIDLFVQVTEAKTNTTDPRALSVVMSNRLGDYPANWARKFRPYKHAKPNSKIDQLAEQTLIEFFIAHYHFLFFFNPHKELDDRKDEWQHMVQQVATLEAHKQKLQTDAHYIKSTVVLSHFAKKRQGAYFRAWKEYTQKSPALLEQRRRRLEELTAEVTTLRTTNMDLERKLQTVSNELELKQMREDIRTGSTSANTSHVM